VQVGQAVKKGDALFTIGGQRITAPRAGTIISLNAKEGASVGTMQSLVALADIDPIRVVLDVYPKDMDRVRIGQRAQIFLIGHEDEIFEGQVVYISPSLSAGSQSLKVGIDVANRGGHLKYGMFVHGKILDRVSEAALLIPEEAVTVIGQEPVIFVEKGPGEFEKRPIKVGRRGRKKIEVLAGLSNSEKVVAKGVFSLKSEALKYLMKEE
jgi:RND family efflux transporter MFP subunit